MKQRNNLAESSGVVFEGEWWLPESPAVLVPGRLSLKDGKYRLDVIRSFSASERSELSDPVQIQTILGITSVARRVTLIDSLRVGSSRHRTFEASASTAAYEPEWILVGEHYSTKDDVRATGHKVDIVGLQEWAKTSGFQNEPHDRNDVDRISHDLPAQLAIGKGGDAYIITFSSSQSHDRYRQSIEQFAEGVRTSASTAPFTELVRPALWLSDFITFATQQPSPVRRLSLTNYHLPDSVRRGREVSVLSKRFSPSAGDDHDMLQIAFFYPEVLKWTDQIWARWTRLQQECRPFLHYYLQHLVNPSSYSFHRLLTLAIGLEAFHRTMVNEKKISMKRRVKELVEQQPLSVRSVLGNSEGLANCVAQSRDYHAHYFKSETKVAPHEEVILAERLRVLSTSVIMRFLGLSDDVIDALASAKDRKGFTHIPERIS